MYRSSSSGRVSDEFFPHSAAVPTPAFSSPNLKSPSTGALDELPTYNPQSHVAKKERNRLRFAENAVHLIPVVLVLSAIILWFFSSPVQMVSKGNPAIGRVNAPVIYTKIKSGNGKSSLTSKLELKGNDQTYQSKIHKRRNLQDRDSF